MAESEILTVIRLWAAIAWADGVLAEAEASGLRRLIRSADLTPNERDGATLLLEREVAMPDAYLAELDADARRGIYRAACKLAVVDHDFSDAERKLLHKLRVILDIPDATADQIEADVPGVKR
jgi:uncharacterized membrane protein YebE (DUF533 family)